MGDFRIEKYQDVKVNKDTIKIVVARDGNNYMPYILTLKALFGDKYLTFSKKLRPEMKDHFVTIGGKLYLPVYDLRWIFQYVNDEDLKRNMITQHFGISSKIEPITKMSIALSAFASASNYCTTLYDDINEYEKLLCDIEHNIENATSDKELLALSKELKSVRNDRRKAKDKYAMIHIVKVFLDEKHIGEAAMMEVNKKFNSMNKRIKAEYDDPSRVVYFSRSRISSNAVSMKEKIVTLKEHFEGR